MKITPYLIARAEKIASKSPVRVQVAAILINRRTGRIIATGYNNHGRNGRRGRDTVHAEVDALNKVRKPSTNLIMFLYRKGRKPIHPCHACQEVARAYGVDIVIWGIPEEQKIMMPVEVPKKRWGRGSWG
jgi:deoxycytidylate deaminase